MKKVIKEKIGMRAINKACQKNRRECSKLSPKERQDLLDKAMGIIDFDTHPTPQIRVLGFKTQKDGSALMDYEVNKAFIQSYLVDSKAKKFTKAGLNKWILARLKESIKNFKNEKTNKKT